MASDDLRAAHLADPAVLRALRAAVRKWVPESDVDDVVQNTLLAAVADPNYPEKRAVFIAWLITKGRSRAIDHLRSQRRRGSVVGDDLQGDVDAVSGDRIDAAADGHDAVEAVQFAKTRIESDAANPTTARGARWLLLHLRGESYDDIADDDGTTPETVQHSVARLRRRLRAAWIAAAIGALLFAVVRGLFGRSTEEEHARPAPAPMVPTAEPSPSAPPPVIPGPEEFARQLRRDAARECKEADWERCLEDLERANSEDPAGAGDPNVKRLMRDARDGLQRSQDKPTPKIK